MNPFCGFQTHGQYERQPPLPKKLFVFEVAKLRNFWNSIFKMPIRHKTILPASSPSHLSPPSLPSPDCNKLSPNFPNRVEQCNQQTAHW